MRYGIYGAGAIGAYLGGRLAQVGAEVCFLGRGALAQAASTEGGLRLRDLAGREHRVPASFTQDARDLARCDVVLLAVRTLDTEDAGRVLRDLLAPGAVVFSCQNGVSNPEALGRLLGPERVAGGVVSFNVLIDGAQLSQETGGPVLLGRPAAAPGRADQLASDLRAAGLEAAALGDIRPALWSKLFLNLGNAIGALTDLPIASFLADPDGRGLYADAIDEGVRLLSKAGITPAKIGRRDPRVVRRILRLPLPRPLARVLVKRVYGVSDEARSSTSRDLRAGKKTEIDSLNGEIVRLAASLGDKAPVNESLTRLVHQAEADGRSPALSPRALRQRCR